MYVSVSLFQMCLHPEVISYIANVIDSVKVMLESKDVEMVALVILDQSQNPLERFVFELGNPTSNNGRSESSHTVKNKLFEHKIVIIFLSISLTVCLG